MIWNSSTNVRQMALTPQAYLPLQYLYAMVSGKGKLDHVQNQRYPQTQPTLIQQFLQTMQPYPTTV